ncbi:MAG: hypothetical protein E3J56_13150 [Candidatus Aminicenantes bacterium]|nr:MAG: hypothetical protein E3J56_13150 [Candidatus Aminicenantes bacterium]
MKTKVLIITWLLLLTIFMLRIHGQMKGRSTNENLLDVKNRVAVLELDFQHNQGRVEEEIKEWFKDRRIVPVGRRILLAVEREDK